jgi:hypothetical protein
MPPTAMRPPCGADAEIVHTLTQQPEVLGSRLELRERLTKSVGDA